jgi:hypothetical protein
LEHRASKERAACLAALVLQEVQGLLEVLDSPALAEHPVEQVQLVLWALQGPWGLMEHQVHLGPLDPLVKRDLKQPLDQLERQDPQGPQGIPALKDQPAVRERQVLLAPVGQLALREPLVPGVLQARQGCRERVDLRVHQEIPEPQGQLAALGLQGQRGRPVLQGLLVREVRLVRQGYLGLPGAQVRKDLRELRAPLGPRALQGLLGWQARMVPRGPQGPAVLVAFPGRREHPGPPEYLAL